MSSPSTFEAVMAFGIGLLGLACALVLLAAFVRDTVRRWGDPVVPRWVTDPAAGRRGRRGWTHRNRRGF